MKRIYNIIFIILLILPLLNSSSAHEKNNGTHLSGIVLDHQTRELLTGVKITSEKLNVVTYTDFNGKFNIQIKNNQIFDLQLDYISYKTVLIEDVKVYDDHILIYMFN